MAGGKPTASAAKYALYDSQAVQRFARINFQTEGVPDATTLLNFRHLLEAHDLYKSLFTAINADLAAHGLLLREGALKAAKKAKASVRAFVEHPFHLVKNIFQHRKERYRGLAKNGRQLYTLFGLTNVVIGARTRVTA